MEDKIKVLVIPSDKTGVGSFRSIDPHVALEKNYPDEFSVDIDYEPKLDDDTWLSKYNIIHYHRTLGPYENVEQVLNRLDRLGIISIMDIDDYWSPGMHHPAYHMIKNAKLDEKILNNIKSARNISTTTHIFAKEISKYNKNVWILPNAVNPDQKQHKTELKPSDRIRIGWLGGSSHMDDLKLLSGVVSKCRTSGIIDKIQFVLCGYDTRGTTTNIDKVTGQQTTRPIQPKESVWYEYEKIFTDNFKIVSKDYYEHLHKFVKDEFDGVDNEPYRRVWTKPITSYASNYSMFDISLAPIVTNKFNEVKSQLKVIESGFHRKALIAQNYGPYTIDLKSARMYGGGFDDTANSLLVDPKKNHSDWFESIKFLVNNPERIKILGNNLNKLITENYHIDVIAEKRKELYHSLVEQNVEQI